MTRWKIFFMASPENPDRYEEPVIDIGINDAIVEARRDNAHLVQHIAELALYDHILVVVNEGKEIIRSYWIFAQIHPEMYNPLSETMVEHNYPQHYFVPILSDMIKDAYELQLNAEASDLEMGVPSEWLK